MTQQIYLPIILTIGEATRQYQVALEHHRSVDDPDSLADLDDAERALNAAWLKHRAG